MKQAVQFLAMAKIDIAKVADILRQNQLEPAVMRRILEQINKVTEEAAAAEDEKPPAQKKQFVEDCSMFMIKMQ